MAQTGKNVTIVVLGDIGRSPRMQYHALSLRKAGHVVDIIGYGDTQPMEELKNEEHIYYHYMLSPPRLPIRLVNYIFKTIWSAITLLFLLLFTRKADILLVQNPPAIPSLIICWIFCITMRAKFVIDWHNYAHSIMALNAGKRSLLVKLTEIVESFMGRRADANLCVTNAMREDLRKRWNIEAVTLYDRPPTIFRPITLEEKHKFLQKLAQTYSEILDEDGSSIFTEVVGEEIKLKNNRPGLIVSSTSWTEDEDFAVLFAALQAYEDEIEHGNTKKLPKLVCVITGKGPLKDYYCRKIAEQSWHHIVVITPWLESTDYPLMLASADLGVSLHTSSSGLDLPMKVVDMFGCELPVCAYNFECLHELVKNGENGYTFSTSLELTKQIQSWFANFPKNEKHKEIEFRLKTNLHAFQNVRWDENWKQVASNIFE